MDRVVLLLLIPACGVLWAVRRLLLFPVRLSEWKYAFGAENREARRALHDARRRKRTVEREGSRKVSAAKRDVRAIERSGQERIRELERKREELLRLGWGDQVGEPLGQLRLHQHVLVFLKDVPEGEERPPGVDGEMPLAGLDVKPQLTPETTFIHLTRPDGTKRTVDFPRTRHRQADVQHFADRIHNQALKDDAFRSSRQSRAAEIADEIEQVKTDTAAKKKEGHREVAELIQTQRSDPRRTRADADWQAQCDAWQELTGRRPSWWWRW